MAYSVPWTVSLRISLRDMVLIGADGPLAGVNSDSTVESSLPEPASAPESRIQGAMAASQILQRAQPLGAQLCLLRLGLAHLSLLMKRGADPCSASQHSTLPLLHSPLETHSRAGCSAVVEMPGTKLWAMLPALLVGTMAGTIDVVHLDSASFEHDT